jgi:hypothetical protein
MFKKYRDDVNKLEFMMRPYELNEDMTFIHYGTHTPEEGDMIAYSESETGRLFLISKAEFETDFVEV